MLGLGLPEPLLGVDFSHHGTGPQTSGFDFVNRRERRLLLLFVRVEDGRTVARSKVTSLLLVGCGVVDLEEVFEDGPVGYDRGIEEDFDCFGVPLVVAVARIGAAAAGVTDSCRHYTSQSPEHILHAPEASAGQHCLLCRHFRIPPTGQTPLCESSGPRRGEIIESRHPIDNQPG